MAKDEHLIAHAHTHTHTQVLPNGRDPVKSPLVDVFDEVVLEVELLEGVQVLEGPLLQLLDQVVVQHEALEAREGAERVALDQGDAVLCQMKGLQTHKMSHISLAAQMPLEGERERLTDQLRDCTCTLEK